MTNVLNTLFIIPFDIQFMWCHPKHSKIQTVSRERCGVCGSTGDRCPEHLYVSLR